MRVVALIPARGGSKGVKRKNICQLKGNPLIYYAINTAKLSSMIDEVWVSTEDTEISYVAKKEGAKVLSRPKELATDEIASEPVLLHFAGKVNFDVLVFLQCTSPLLKVEHLNEGISSILFCGYDSAFSVTTITQFIWKGHKQLYPIHAKYLPFNGKRMRRQELTNEDIYKLETGAFYITTRKALLESNSRISGWVKPVEVPFWDSFEVDTHADLHYIGKLMP